MPATTAPAATVSYAPRRRLQRLAVFKRDRPHWSHTSTYRRAAENPGLLVKMGRMSLIDLDIADRIEDAFPDAVITTGSRHLTQKQAKAAAATKAARKAAKAAAGRRRRSFPTLVSASEF